ESREGDLVDEECEGHLSVSHGRQEPAAGRLFTEDQPYLCSDEQPVHGLRRRAGQVPSRPAVRRRDRREPRRSGRQPRRVHRMGSDHEQESLGHQGTAGELGRRARHRRRRGLLRDDGGMAEGGEREDRRAVVEVQDAVRHHRQPDDLRRTRREAVRRRVVRYRRLVGHRRRRRHRRGRSDGGPRRPRRVRRRRQLQQPGRRADGVRASIMLSRSTILLLGAACVFCASLALAAAPKPFRVCADPENMPFSNQKMEGFENRIAEVIAKDLGAPLRFIWWGQRRGFIRNTMNATLEEGRCEVMIGAPAGYDLVRTTKPYYRSTYVFVYRKDKGFQIKTLDDPILKTVRIGVHVLGEDYSNTPPAHELSKRGIVSNVKGFD